MRVEEAALRGRAAVDGRLGAVIQQAPDLNRFLISAFRLEMNLLPETDPLLCVLLDNRRALGHGRSANEDTIEGVFHGL